MEDQARGQDHGAGAIGVAARVAAGTLNVDAYSGYNVVANVSRRKRAACHAHLRRYFQEALPTAPIAQEAIDLILGFYRVEHNANDFSLTTHLAFQKYSCGHTSQRKEFPCS